MRQPVKIPLPIVQPDEDLAETLQEIAVEGVGVPGLDEPAEDLVSVEHAETPRTNPQPYERFMKNERPDRRSEIFVDEANGLRYQMWGIGTNRNIPEDRKKPMKVYIDPIPHVVLDQHVPLRG